MIEVAKISFTKTFIGGMLEGIVIPNEYFYVPIAQADGYAATMRHNAAANVVHGDSGSQYTTSNIEVEV